MTYLTSDDKLDDRIGLQSAEAENRLYMIKEARNEALSKFTMALDEFIEVVDRERVDGNSISEKERLTTIEMLSEQLAEVECDAVRCLERMERCEGEFDLCSDDGDRS